MNLPIGEAVFEHEHAEILKRIRDLMAQKFSGYVCVTISNNGIEDAALILREGKAVAAFYEFLSFNKVVFAETALEGFLNACLCKNIVADCYRLAKHQIDLILAFNEHLKFKKEYNFVQLERIKPKKYSTKFAEQVLNVKPQEETRIDVLRRFGLEKL